MSALSQSGPISGPHLYPPENILPVRNHTILSWRMRGRVGVDYGVNFGLRIDFVDMAVGYPHLGITPFFKLPYVTLRSEGRQLLDGKYLYPNEATVSVLLDGDTYELFRINKIDPRSSILHFRIWLPKEYNNNSGDIVYI